MGDYRAWRRNSLYLRDLPRMLCRPCSGMTLETTNTRLKTITANRILLKGRDGAARLLLDASAEDGGAEICLFGSDHSSIALSIRSDGHCNISMRKPSGQTSVCLGVKPNGQSGFDLYDAIGKPCVMVSSRDKNTPTSVTIFGDLDIRRIRKRSVRKRKRTRSS